MTARQVVNLERRLAVHCDALGACRRCAHPDSVRPIIADARTPRVMLIGQAPGKSEVGNRRAFAGRAGRTLFRWLAEAGVDEATARAHIYIAAITRCYPGPSESGRGDRVPSAGERANCADWLDKELDIIRPRLIIPVGRLAIDRILRPAPLDQLIGEKAWFEHAGGRARVIPLPHPSGASSWIQDTGHSSLLARALSHLRVELRVLGVRDGPRLGRGAA